jgi:voltage-gated potassium channel
MKSKTGAWPDQASSSGLSGWRLRGYTVIFEGDTVAGRGFDLWLIVLILCSIAVVMADSITHLHERYSFAFTSAEWVFTALFTLEYLARLARSPKP